MGHARGEVEVEDRVLVIKRIHVTYTGLVFDVQDHEKVERVLRVHADGCPVARSIRDSIKVTTALG